MKYLHKLLEFFCVGDLSVLPIYLFLEPLFLYWYGLVYVFHIWGCNPLLLGFVQLVLGLAMGDSFDISPSLNLLVLRDPPPSLPYFPGTIRFSRFILSYFICPNPGISHFPQELLFLPIENPIRNQNLGTRHACCF